MSQEVRKELFSSYAVVMNEIKRLEEEAERLKPELIKEMNGAEADTIQSDYGTFSLVKREKWEYSDETKGAEETIKNTIKQLQEEERTKGIAKLTTTTSLMYKQRVEKSKEENGRRTKTLE